MGTIIHWDIEENETSQIDDFEIEGDGSISEVDVFSLNGKTNNGKGGSCQIKNSPGNFFLDNLIVRNERTDSSKLIYQKFFVEKMKIRTNSSAKKLYNAAYQK